MNKELRIGVTLRTSNAEGYNEPRDALARDWYACLDFLLEGEKWVLIPNLGEPVLDYVNAHALNGFILTGGDSVGDSPVRDATEKTLLKFAIENKLPLYGICRGLQLLHVYFGGKLSQCDADVHVAKEHEVDITPGAFQSCFESESIRVNSYHHFGFKASDVDKQLDVVAQTSDEIVEAMGVKGLPIFATMWHPERNNPFQTCDQRLFHKIFKEKMSCS